MTVYQPWLRFSHPHKSLDHLVINDLSIFTLELNQLYEIMSCKFKPDLNAFEALQKTQPVDKYVVQYQRKKKKKKKKLTQWLLFDKN